MRLFTCAWLAAAGLLLSLTTNPSALAQTVQMDPPPIDPPGPNYCPIPRMLAGEIDSCYGYYDHGLGVGANGQVHVVKSLAGGKTLIGGAFTTYNSQWRGGLARVNPNGSLDSGFVTGSGFNGEVLDMAVLPDGKIMAVGTFTKYDGADSRRIARLLPNGTLDNSFAAGTGFDTTAHQILLAPGGRMLVRGEFGRYGSRARKFLARLHADGSLDTTFAPADTLPLPRGMALQSNGRVVYSFWPSSTRPSILTALDSTGAVDNAFATSPLGLGIYKVRALAGDTLMVFRAAQNLNSGPILLKMNPNGVRVAFSTVFMGIEAISDVQADAAGMLTIAFSLNLEGPAQESNGLSRLRPNGGRDSTLVPLSVPAPVYSFDWMQDGSQRTVYSGAIGYAGTRNLHATFQDGQPDTDFNIPEHFNGPINSLVAFPGNMALAIGSFSMVKGEEHPGMIKLTPGGNRHPDFFAERTVYSAIMQPDTIIMGLGRDRSGLQTTVYRFNKNGQYLEEALVENTLSSFHPKLVPYSPDGKAILLGQRGEMRILNVNGTHDTTLLKLYTKFGTNQPFFDAIVNDALALPDGRLVVVGKFNKPNLSSTPGIAWLSPEGLVDTAFYDRLPVAEPIHAWKIVRRQPDGKILVAGGGNRLKNNSTFAGLLRLNADGTRDTTFRLRPLANAAVLDFTDIALQADGKILVAGDGQNYDKLERLKANGTHDSTFLVPQSVEGTVHAILPRTDKPAILIGGDITRVGGKPRSYQAQLFTEGLRTATEEPVVRNIDPKMLRVAPNPTTGIVRVETLVPAHLLSLDGRLLQSARPEGGQAVFNLGALGPGLYLVRSGGKVARVVKE